MSQVKLTQDLNETLGDLKTRNYDLKFRREATCIYCFEWQQWIMPSNFTVDDSFYFQHTINPDADRILYAISLSGGLKGFLIDTCDVYTDNISIEMTKKLKVKNVVRRRTGIANTEDENARNRAITNSFAF
jgi:hypothetical protein